MSRQVGPRQVSPAGADDGSAPILHVDMDAFFASVELLDHPELRDRPVAVAHEGARSVVSAANYAAREYGVRSAMPLSVARARCARLIVLEPRGHLYRHYNQIVMRIFDSFTPRVEPLSIDEAFLDVSGAVALFGSPSQIAQSIRERVYGETGLTCSVGVAATKFVAKVASTEAKPDGLLVVPAAHTLDFLWPLPIRALWGVGAVTAQKLESRGLMTIGDIANAPIALLRRAAGDAGAAKLHELAHGRDVRTVRERELRREEKSISHETTFGVDVTDPAQIEQVLLDLSRKVARRLRSHGLVAKTIAVKLRQSSFETASRSRSLAEPTDVSQVVAETARELFAESGLSGRALRLVGVRAEALVPVDQAPTAAPLWGGSERWQQADRAIDQLESRFGRDMVRPARLLDADSGDGV